MREPAARGHGARSPDVRGRESHARGSRLLPAWALLFWALLAALACPVGAWIAQTLHTSGAGERSFLYELGHGTFIGLLVGAILGLRTRSLLGVVLGPSLGLAAGLLDLRVATYLFEHSDLELTMIAFLPTWGFVMGMGVGMTRKRRWLAPAVALTLALLEFCSRWGGSEVTPRATTALWFWNSLTFVPAAVAAVTLTRPADTRASRDDQGQTSVAPSPAAA